MFRWPWTSVSRLDDLQRELNMRIGDRDRRIAELEAERKMLWDKLSEIGLGGAIFAKPPQPNQTQVAAQPEPPTELKPALTRPSRIMAHMTGQATERWLRKVNPSRGQPAVAPMVQELNMRQFDQIDADLAKKMNGER